jgi:uncharacterized protein YjbI with pentapeptide repeats
MVSSGTVGEPAITRPPHATRSQSLSWGQRPSLRRRLSLSRVLCTSARGQQPTDPPFKDLQLTGADVFWLSVLHLSHADPHDLEDLDDDYLHQLLTSPLAKAVRFKGDRIDEWKAAQAELPSREVQGTFLSDPDVGLLQGLDLRGADLAGADLRAALLDGANLRGADLTRAQLESASLRRCNLDGSYLDGVQASASCFRRASMGRCYARLATFTGADLRDVDFTEAVLRGSRFDAANLGGASLVRCKLTRASFRSAYLFQTRLAGSRLLWANFGPAGIDQKVEASLEKAGWLGFITDEPAMQYLQLAANLTQARFDAESELNDIFLWKAKEINPQVADVVWGDVNLTVVSGWGVKTGDETRAEHGSDPDLYDRAARTNRQLAVHLRGQGLSDASDFYGYRAKVCERRTFWLRHAYLRWAGSTFLGGICGWGFRPGRTVLWYLTLLLSFWAGYARTVRHLSGFQDLVLSVSAFHGRGVFISNLQSLSQPASALVITEAVLGLLIEATFVATFAQRFIGK